MVFEFTVTGQSNSGGYLTTKIREKDKFIPFSGNSFFTQDPILLCYPINEPLNEDALSNIQNEVSGFVVCQGGRAQDVLLFSSKLSRSRIFYSFSNNALLVSDDLRELLPYSKRRLKSEIAYAIIKFGEAPEYDTIIEDIYSIPAGSYLSFDNQILATYIMNRQVPYYDFKKYFSIKYSLKGGSLIETEQQLKEALSAIRPKNPSILVSGGIDSTLLNYLYNEVCDAPYHAYFLDFKEATAELDWAKRSVKNTKACFTPLAIDNNNFLKDFIGSVENLIYPVYDNGSALVGYKFNQYLKGDSSESFIDGTCADSCYGVRNYLHPLKQGKPQSRVMSTLKERIYMMALLNGWSWNRTKPRDAYLDDEFIQDLLWYGGPFVNFWFKNADKFTATLSEKYKYYIDYIDRGGSCGYWEEYTVLKMMLYAAKQTTVKVYDMLKPHQVYFPFMFSNILQDQGKYNWSEKSEGYEAKAPLKKILEKFIDKEFISRKKTGLQSQTIRWMNEPSIKHYFINLLLNSQVAPAMMGANYRNLIRAYAKENPDLSLVTLTLSLSVIHLWCDMNKVSIR